MTNDDLREKVVQAITAPGTRFTRADAAIRAVLTYYAEKGFSDAVYKAAVTAPYIGGQPIDRMARAMMRAALARRQPRMKQKHDPRTDAVARALYNFSESPFYDTKPDTPWRKAKSIKKYLYTTQAIVALKAAELPKRRRK
ncbi:MAG: hypothetical protein AABZ67_00480 [Pseudomonadota bacterium]